MILALLTAWAGRYAMPQNHPELAWHTVETEHFAIHYPRSRKQDHERAVDGEPMAQQLAARAEDLWLRVCRSIDHFPTERVHVVVMEHTDRLVGFTLTQQGWIVMSGNPGPELARMRGRNGWASDLLAHELAHVISLKKVGFFEEKTGSFGMDIGGLAETEGTQLGGFIPFIPTEPFWWSEGAAEYASERAGVNWWTSSRDMLLRSMVREDRLLSDTEWQDSRLLNGWFEAERAYQQGYAFHRWFAKTYGDAAWHEVMRRSSRRFRWQWDRAYEKVTGQPLKQLKRAFEAELRSRADKQTEAREAEGLIEGTEVATWRLGWNEPGLKARDRWALKDAESRDKRREGTGTMTLHAKFSEDGRWFARHRSGWLVVRQQDEDMWTVFAGETPDWNLTDAQRDASSAMSAWLPTRYLGDFDFVPGADALITVAFEDEHKMPIAPQGTDWTRLYRVDLDSITRQGKEQLPESPTLVPIPGTLRAGDPSVSPDGQWLAYLVYGKGSRNLVVSKLDGSERRQLTDFSDGTWMQGTDWSPDGTQIVSAVHQHHQQNLWTFTASTGTPTPLMGDGWEELDPHWAGDGSIWFSADVDGFYDIFRRSPEGRIDRMTRVATGAVSPTLTPDGELLYHHFTAWGWKTHAKRTSELAWQDVSDRFELPMRVSTPTPTPLPSHRYRPHRSVTSVSFNPSFRLDRTVDGQVLPRLGLFLKVRDAVEVNTWTVNGWIGKDASISGRWAWHRFWPDLVLHGSHWAGRLPHARRRRQLTTGGLRLKLPWREDLSAELAWYGVVVQEETDRYRPTHRTSVFEIQIHAGEWSPLLQNDLATGGAMQLVLSRGDSRGDRITRFHRVEGDAVWTIEPARRHRWVFEGAFGFTDRAVEREDSLRLGGDHSHAIRPGRVQSTASFPGYRPYAFTAQHHGRLGFSWRIPLGTDLRQGIGPYVVHTVMLALGGDGGLLADGSSPQVLADGRIDLRFGGTLWGTRFNTLLRAAYGRKLGPDIGGTRVILALGSGF